MGNSTSQNTNTAASSSNSNSSSSSSSSSGSSLVLKKGTLVLLNVYEPQQGQSGMPGFGVYHTGLEVNGTEYSYAGSPGAYGSGVSPQSPRVPPAGSPWKFKETIELGYSPLTYSELMKALDELREAFLAGSYDVVHQNCNHFTTAAARRLGVFDKYPGWVNRAANWGSAFTAKPKGHIPAAALMPKQKPNVFQSSKGYSLAAAAAAANQDNYKQQNNEKRNDTHTTTHQHSSQTTTGTNTTTTNTSNSSSSSSQSSGTAKPAEARKNPWRDPNFLPGKKTTSTS